MAELKNRMPIYPKEVREKDMDIDDLRRENYKNSLDSIYPSHYLVDHPEQPEIKAMLRERVGQIQRKATLKNKSFAQSTQANQSEVYT